MTMTGNNRGLLVLAGLAGLAAAVLVFVALASAGGDDGGSSAPAATSVNVVVASQRIAAGTEITAEMLKVVEIPENLVISGHYADSSLVVGETTSVAIPAGEQITTEKLGSYIVDNDAVSGVLTQQERGLGFSIQEVTAVGGLLQPGDHVDIVATYNIRSATGLGENEYIQRTEVILQNVEVISVAQLNLKPEPQPKAAGDESTAATDDVTYASGELPDEVEEQPRASTLTLKLDPDQTLKLISFQDSPATVRIWSALRGFGNTVILDIAPYDQIITEE